MPEYFTVKTANMALPAVAERYERVVARKADAARAEKAAQMAAGGRLDSYADAKRRLNAAVTDFYRSVQELEETGAMLKNVDEGLLDFPSRRFDQDVWLCWKSGEGEIKFWHERDSGFGGRKPIGVSDETLV